MQGLARFPDGNAEQRPIVIGIVDHQYSTGVRHYTIRSGTD
jgi:hypothetical protein